jgi:hypothetical protein
MLSSRPPRQALGLSPFSWRAYMELNLGTHVGRGERRGGALRYSGCGAKILGQWYFLESELGMGWSLWFLEAMANLDAVGD